MMLTMKENIDLYREKMIKVQKLVLEKSDYVEFSCTQICLQHCFYIKKKKKSLKILRMSTSIWQFFWNWI